jgi:DNA processing protein
MEMTRRRALMVLAGLPGMGPMGVRQLERNLGGKLERALHIPLPPLPLSEGLQQVLADWPQRFDLEKSEAVLRSMGADFVIEGDAAYPERLAPLTDRPLGLYRYGTESFLGNRSIAIVGTRRPSQYGRQQARLFARGLAELGFTVVSGLAEGVDTEAHRAALEAGGATAAFLGGGLRRLYPAGNRALMERIAHSAGVWTEFPLFRKADRRSFPQRNRLVAGVSEGVVVIESGASGGSLITARMAAEQGRPVYVVPGRVDVPEAAGCHALIRDGAQLVTEVEDILSDLSFLPSRLHLETISAAPEIPELEGVAARLWEAFRTEGRLRPEVLVEQLDEGIARVQQGLLELEMKGLVERTLDGSYECQVLPR